MLFQTLETRDSTRGSLKLKPGSRASKFGKCSIQSKSDASIVLLGLLNSVKSLEINKVKWRLWIKSERELNSSLRPKY